MRKVGLRKIRDDKFMLGAATELAFHRISHSTPDGQPDGQLADATTLAVQYFSYVLYSYGQYSYGLYGYGLYSYGLYSYGLYSYGLYSYGYIVMAQLADTTTLAVRCLCVL